MDTDITLCAFFIFCEFLYPGGSFYSSIKNLQMVGILDVDFLTQCFKFDY